MRARNHTRAQKKLKNMLLNGSAQFSEPLMVGVESHHSYLLYGQYLWFMLFYVTKEERVISLVSTMLMLKM
jgi:hypothetical protein